MVMLDDRRIVPATDVPMDRAIYDTLLPPNVVEMVEVADLGVVFGSMGRHEIRFTRGALALRKAIERSTGVWVIAGGDAVAALPGIEGLHIRPAEAHLSGTFWRKECFRVSLLYKIQDTGCLQINNILFQL